MAPCPVRGIEGGRMQVGLMAPQGWKGEYDGWGPADAWARTIELAEQAEDARVRVALGLRPLPHRARSRPTRSPSSRSRSWPRWRWSTEPRPARPHGRLHGVPQPGPDGQAGLDHRRHQRRPVRARHRRRLEGGRVAGLRLRLPDRSASGWPPSATISRSSRGCSRPAGRPYRGRLRPRPRRDQRARRASSSRASRSSSAATARGVTAGYAIRYRRRAELRVPRARRDRRADGRRPRSAARRRAATRRRCGSRCTPATRTCATPGQARVDRLAAFAAIGLDRIVCFPTRWSPTLEAQAAFAEDCRAAGVDQA